MNKIVDFFKKNILKNKRNLFIFIGVIVILIIIISVIILNNNVTLIILGDDDSKMIMLEYEELNNVKTEDGYNYPKVNIDRNNKFMYTNINEILNILNNRGDAVIYFGFSKCLYCRTAIQMLHDVAKDTEIERILYLDVEDKIDGYDRLVDKLNDKFLNIDGDKKEIYSPLVLFIADGEIVSYNKGTLDSQESPYNEFDQSQIAGLKEIYKYGIRDVLEGLKSK